eukprot:TRINITY_DN3184_c0_g1_i3.p1 TRINITY_DN3184_c0_g1~~TRINITY_DN3184_c0_g1_i3.p1  ORF type:complete len:482 (+),score=99.43 TRINITY_DN3184_c0_g1_i3:126-1571(+)
MGAGESIELTDAESPSPNLASVKKSKKSRKHRGEHEDRLHTPRSDHSTPPDPMSPLTLASPGPASVDPKTIYASMHHGPVVGGHADPWEIPIPPPPKKSLGASVFEVDDLITKSMPAPLRDTLLWFDLFPYFPNPTVQNVVGARSCLGFLGSLMMCAVLAVFVSLSLRDFIRRNDATVVQVYGPQRMDLGYDVEVGFSVMFGKVPMYNDSLFTLNMYQQINTFDTNKSIVVSSKVQHTFKPCYFGDISPSFDTGVCPVDPKVSNDIKRIHIQGEYASPRFDFFVVELYQCDPSTSKVRCETDKNVLTPLFQDLSLNVILPIRKKLDEPVVQTYYFSFDDFDRATKTDIYLERSVTYDSKPVYFGWETRLIEEYFRIGTLDARTALTDKKYRVWKGNLRIDLRAFEETRIYRAVPNLFASWGGFITFITTVFSFIFLTYNSYKFMQYRTWDVTSDVKDGHQRIKCTIYPVDDLGHLRKSGSS